MSELEEGELAVCKLDFQVTQFTDLELSEALSKL